MSLFEHILNAVTGGSLPNIVGSWRFKLSSDGYKGILGGITFSGNDTYSLRVFQGEIWDISSAGRYQLRPRPADDNSDAILVLMPQTWDIPSYVPVTDLRSLHYTTIVLKQPAEYRIFRTDEGFNLCHTTLQPKNRNFQHCNNPWRIERT